MDSSLYKSNIEAWKKIYSAEGLRGVFTGWSPTFVGYAFQGAGKYGFYEVFKYYYGETLFPNAPKTLVYLGASASAEFLADMALCPFESIKVRMQTTIPPYAKTLREGWSNVAQKEGVSGLYKGLYPLWARQIPYTMVKFASFEKAVEMIYKQLGKPKESYNALQQTGVSFLGGYIAGVGCAVVSHPADVMVSKLNADRKPGEGAMTAVGRIYKNIGFPGLWNGLPVRIFMIGTLTAFQWLIYDSFKVYCGVSINARSVDRVTANTLSFLLLVVTRTMLMIYDDLKDWRSAFGFGLGSLMIQQYTDIFPVWLSISKPLVKANTRPPCTFYSYLNLNSAAKSVLLALSFCATALYEPVKISSRNAGPRGVQCS